MPTKKRAHSRKNRVYTLREFIIQTYNINTTTKILDIAGGKGDLSWLLTNVDKINQSTIVDPRECTNHNHILRSIDYLSRNPDQVKERSVRDSDSYQPIAPLLHKLIPSIILCQDINVDIHAQYNFKTPKHLRLFINQEFISSIKHAIEHDDESLWNNYWETQKYPTKQNHIISNPKEALKTIKETNILIGFHPDHATEYIIDLAILLKIPFCIVPCCVFPSAFSWRRLEGVPVRTYDEFIVYLEQKFRGVRKDYLKFYDTTTARNIALYTLPEDMI